MSAQVKGIGPFTRSAFAAAVRGVYRALPMKLITKTDELAAFCKPLADAEYVTVDTEFMRERTYWPKLCLAQVAGPDDAAAIDALAEGIDLAPLDELMANPKVLKVFHAARQDLEIFYLRMNSVPTPLFDTQVAAMVCGHGEAASYESLATKLAKAKIDKSSRFTDWSRRPLSERQITYALSDVTHLRVVYEKLRKHLEKSGRLLVDRRGNGGTERSRHLPRRSRAGLAPAQAARRLAAADGDPQGGRGLARAHRTAHRHSPPAPAARRAAPGDRQPRSQDDRRAGGDPWARTRVRRGLAGPRTDGSHRARPRDPRGGSADARQGARTAARARRRRRPPAHPSPPQGRAGRRCGTPRGERRRARPDGGRQARPPCPVGLAARDIRRGCDRPYRGPAGACPLGRASEADPGADSRSRSGRSPT